MLNINEPIGLETDELSDEEIVHVCGGGSIATGVLAGFTAAGAFIKNQCLPGYTPSKTKQ
jgi:hypothetical protein